MLSDRAAVLSRTCEYNTKFNSMNQTQLKPYMASVISDHRPFACVITQLSVDGRRNMLLLDTNQYCHLQIIQSRPRFSYSYLLLCGCIVDTSGSQLSTENIAKHQNTKDCPVHILYKVRYCYQFLLTRQFEASSLVTCKSF